MVRRVNFCDLPLLVKTLDNYIPDVIRVQSNIRSVIHGNCDGQVVWVDQWPDVKTVVCVIDSLSSNFAYWRDRLEIYTSCFDSLVKVLRHNEVVKWSRTFQVAAVSSVCLDAITLVAHEKNGKIVLLPQLYMYYLSDQVAERLGKYPTINRKFEGFYFADVDISLASLLAHNWEPESGSDGENYIRALIKHFPSSALYNKDGCLIGYCLLYYYFALGLLFVKNEYRGKGYGEIITIEIIRKLRKLYPNQTPYLVVQRRNISALRLYEKMGFNRIKGTLEWFLFQPMV